MKAAVLILFLAVPVCSQTIEHSPYSDSVELSYAEKSAVDSAFNFISNELGFIDYSDCNNCNSRAHLLSAILEKRFPALKLAKAWLFADFKRASKEEIYTLRSKPYLASGNDCISWGYHVAPVVIVSNGKGTDTIVLDPSTQNKPVSVRRWAATLIQKGGTALLIIKEKKYYLFPDNDSKKFEDMKQDWVDDDKTLYDDDYSKSIDKILMSNYKIREQGVLNWEIKKIEDMLYTDDE